MRKERAAICFHCGGPADAAGRLNRLPEGHPCPACAERLLSSMPPLVPGFRHAVEAMDAVPAETELDEPA